ncbi:MAG: hypothetical protein EKK52_10970 [Burkholderiales bacterium]|nr:MAG: hypothetical protein EKK52_10970 [Burkholderiales bacterium]
MPWVRRIIALLCLALALGLAGCSALTLAYNQLPLLAGFWASSYLDLEPAQQARLREQLRLWLAWHRREELPHLQALLLQASAALQTGGMTADELLALERAGRASLERCLQHAAPLAAPLLAELRPAQWLHLQHKLDDDTDEWKQRYSGRDAPSQRAARYVKTLERWLGDLDRAARRQARAEAEGWQMDLPRLLQARAQRQAGTIEALQAWARQDLAGGTAQLMRMSQTLPAEQAYREEIMASVLRLFQGLDAGQREQVRRHWADWMAQLRTLQAASS